MAVLRMATKAVLMNHRYSRGMRIGSSGLNRTSLPCPLFWTISAKLLSVAFTGIKSGGSLTVDEAGVSAVLNSQYSGNKLTMATNVSRMRISTCGSLFQMRRSNVFGKDCETG